MKTNPINVGIVILNRVVFTFEYNLYQNDITVKEGKTDEAGFTNWGESFRRVVLPYYFWPREYNVIYCKGYISISDTGWPLDEENTGSPNMGVWYMIEKDKSPVKNLWKSINFNGGEII